MGMLKIGTEGFDFTGGVIDAPQRFRPGRQPQHLAIQRLPAVFPQHLIAGLQRHAHHITVANAVFHRARRHQGQRNQRPLIMG